MGSGFKISGSSRVDPQNFAQKSYFYPGGSKNIFGLGQ